MPTPDWIGKKAVVGHHREVPFHLLKTNEALSVGEPGSGNLLMPKGIEVLESIRAKIVNTLSRS